LTGWVGTNTDIEDRKMTSGYYQAQFNALKERVEKRNRELDALNAGSLRPKPKT